MFGPKIKISRELLDRLTQHAEERGYASVEEFITHVLESELARLERPDVDPRVDERLKGLGYV